VNKNNSEWYLLERQMIQTALDAWAMRINEDKRETLGVIHDKDLYLPCPKCLYLLGTQIILRKIINRDLEVFLSDEHKPHNAKNDFKEMYRKMFQQALEKLDEGK